MKLKRFNETINNYSSYDDVISLLEEAIYLLEVSFNYNVDVNYQFEDLFGVSTCVLSIKPVNWNLQKHISLDLDKKELLEQDLQKIQKMFQPYLTKTQHPFKKTYYSNNNILRIFIHFNLFCQLCQNQELVCPNCDGNKSILCGCGDGTVRVVMEMMKVVIVVVVMVFNNVNGVVELEGLNVINVVELES